MKTALVGFAVGGQSYIRNAKYVKQKNWDIYAALHGYDSYLFDFLLDDSMHRSNVMMQKLLVFNRLKDYDRVIYLDTDIVINPLSPPFPFTSQSDQIWAVPFVPWEGVSEYCKRFNLSWNSIYLPQGGVIGLQGPNSFELFEKIYWGKELRQDHPVHALIKS